ncbi:MAG TPA: hypothetical protein PK358_09335 [Spirochaetota bacterium]|nr:hypothetical protein [Spirochaetota bacterium]
MIKLINGFVVEYSDDFDRFFQNLLEAVIQVSRQSAIKKKTSPEESRTERDIFLQEIMDNCIYITHQLFTIYKDNEKFTKFIITGFIFNSVIIALNEYEENSGSNGEENDQEGGVLH